MAACSCETLSVSRMGRRAIGRQARGGSGSLRRARPVQLRRHRWALPPARPACARVRRRRARGRVRNVPPRSASGSRMPASSCCLPASIRKSWRRGSPPYRPGSDDARRRATSACVHVAVRDDRGAGEGRQAPRRMQRVAPRSARLRVGGSRRARSPGMPSRTLSQTLLETPAYRDRALALAAEIAAMPEPLDVARRLSAAVPAWRPRSPGSAASVAPPSRVSSRSARSARSGTRRGRGRSRAASRPRARSTAAAPARSPSPRARRGSRPSTRS